MLIDTADTAAAGIVVTAARRGFSVSWRGRQLLSRIDPVGQAEKAAAAENPLPQTLYVCPRPLFGYGLALFLQSLPETSAVAAVETDAALFDWTRRHIDPALPPRCVVLYAPSAAALITAVKDCFSRRRFRRVKLLPLSAAWQPEAARYTGLVDSLQTELAREWGNAMTLTKLGRLYAKNLFRNLPLLAVCPSAAALHFGRTPVLVAGAGPSLHAALDDLIERGLLHQHGEHGGGQTLRVIAVDTALSALVDRGILVDLAVALEAQHWNIGDFVGLNGRGIPLAMDVSALPLTARIFKNPPYLFWTEWTQLRFLDRLTASGLLPVKLPPLGSVGLSACALARRLTTGTVFCAGLDFAFTADLYHCRASPSHKTLLFRHGRLKNIYPVASVYREGAFAFSAPDGGPARTDPNLERYRAIFDSFAAGSIVRLWGGAIDGWEPAPKAAGEAPATPCGWRGEAVGAGGLAGEGGLTAAGGVAGANSVTFAAFIAGERERLTALRGILTGETADTAKLDSLLAECDYLWAHFPDCAGKGGWHPPPSEVSFLKRVRVEIEPFLRLVEK